MHNPILPGFNPDPTVCKKGDDYYLAVSSFEWLPGIPVYHSTNLRDWTLVHNIISSPEYGYLRRLPSAKGIWAPQLSYSETNGKFYLMYSIMNSTNSRHFEVDNYIIESQEITGPWSKPTYVHSLGFDPSLFIDDDGRAYILSLEWETREGYHEPGVISIVEYDLENFKVIGEINKLTEGLSYRGCVEGAHLFKKGIYYYLMTSEGGTGYGHSIIVQRSKNILGPYENDGRTLISAATDFNEMYNSEAFKIHRYNPKYRLQKTGHGNIVEYLGEYYLFFHTSRPFLPELRCTLGRETAMTKLKFNNEGWFELDKKFDYQFNKDIYSFNSNKVNEIKFDKGIPNCLYAPRRYPSEFVEIINKDAINLRGNEWLSSENSVSLLALKLTSINYEFETNLHFEPELYQHNAGIVVYYDNMNFVTLNMTYDELNRVKKLELRKYENGLRKKFADVNLILNSNNIRIGVKILNRSIRFFYYFNNVRKFLGPHFDTSHLSDEFSEYGEFTGTFVGVYCNDSAFRRKKAKFSKISYMEDRNREQFN